MRLKIWFHYPTSPMVSHVQRFWVFFNFYFLYSPWTHFIKINKIFITRLFSEDWTKMFMRYPPLSWRKPLDNSSILASWKSQDFNYFYCEERMMVVKVKGKQTMRCSLLKFVMSEFGIFRINYEWLFQPITLPYLPRA